MAFSLEAYAIVSVDGMIAGADGVIPDSLKFEADQRYFSDALDGAALLVHGRNSHEGHANSPRRRRFWVTRRVADLEQLSAFEWRWNPAGLDIFDAARRIGVEDGVIAALGGTQVYDLFLPRYRAFHLSRAGRVRIPGGTPFLSAVREGLSPEAVLTREGFAAGETITLDAANEVTATSWERP